MVSSTSNNHIISLCTFLVCCYCYSCSAKDTITRGEFINDGDNYLESPGKKFRMGFFPHGNTTELRRYVGIWYTMDPKTIVWVANRDKPVLDYTGVITVAEDGNFKVLNKDASVYFSTTTEGAPLTTLKLLDTGNVVLIDVELRCTLWQSFETPTDTFIPGMKMGKNLKLTSWRTVTDPGSGSFKFQTDPGTARYSIVNGSTTFLWKSGKMSKDDSFDDNQMFSNAFNFLSNTTTLKRILPNHSPNRTLSYETYVVVDPNSSCLHGFVPISPDDHTQGCMRTSKICDESTKDTFINITMISMDDTNLPFFQSNNESACVKECLKSCHCVAYSYTYLKEGVILDPSREQTHGCWFWDTVPSNLKGNGIHNISFRVSTSSKANIFGTLKKRNTEGRSSSLKRVLAISVVGSALVLSLFGGISYIMCKRLVNRRKKNQNNIEFKSCNTRRHINELLHLGHSKEDDREGLDVQHFELESIIAATNDFSQENLLGQGGFGPVYKGKLPGGQEIAVKRLSSLSRQGLQEFKNEITLIAKLQHINLVRILGYCITGEEKMLLYEYLPNRSLDKFIFDPILRASLDWKMRFSIIMGIARGLNYLHHDSRLRIIHRDLKTSNILLDEEMNPKISDFGLAKIVKGKDMEAVTNKVVGTFGYMSPEYARKGKFSIKSDVFSFGVVLLEILSGKRNTGFYQSQKSTSLLEHAWSLWIEDRPFELLDQILVNSCDSTEVLKCINVGLLCVQGDPDDRPTMTNAVMMLGGDMAMLPNPKEPAVIPRRDHDVSSKNTLTITDVAGR
ncbi:putative protein kinase RLK-Pelle-DLSV family [Helianthus annuus]|nr:putative protein kinase RLK-Pelle-DLSV family [Helianthus annuus]